MSEKLRASAVRALAFARDEARARGNAWLGTEHLLVGVARSGGVAGKILDEHGLTTARIREALDALYGRSYETSQGEKVPATPRARQALFEAARAARDLGRARIGTVHVLFGVLGDEESAACAIVAKLGVSVRLVRGALLDAMRSEVFEEALDAFFDKAPRTPPPVAPIPVARLVDGPLYACPLGHGPMDKLEDGALVVGVCAECRGTFVPGGKMHDVLQAFLREGSP